MNFTKAQKLIEIAAGWKSFRALVNDTEVPWYRINEILRCHSKANVSPTTQAHCFQETYASPKLSFGCLKLWNTRNNWYNCGSPDERHQGRWVIDKDRVRDLLREEIQDQGLRICPLFDETIPLWTIDGLPDFIEECDKEWEFQYANVGNEKRLIKISYKENRQNATISVFASSTPSSTEQEEAKNEQGKSIIKARYSDIGGIEDVIQRVRQIIEWPLLYPEVVSRFGIKPHRGVLLFGPPGCGKTLLAKTIAGDTNASFFSINGPELLSKWYGETEQNLRKVFHQAKEAEPSVILVDELDSFAVNRDSVSSSHEARVVTQLLTLMDGLIDTGRVTVIATTNRPDSIDAALRRPGRFDVSIEIPFPNENARHGIFQVHTRNMPLDDTVNLDFLASTTDGFSGAEIEAVCREAAYHAMERSLNLGPEYAMQANVTDDDFTHGIQLLDHGR